MKKTVWALIDDRMGSNGQVRGITQSLDDSEYKVIEKKLEYTKLAALPNWIKGASLIGINKESRKELKEPYPDLVISGSRRTAPVARWIKKQSKNKTKIVQLMHVWGASHFDLVFVPEHDRHKKTYPNFVYITGTVHRITDKSMLDAKSLWEKEFENLPKPLTAVIVGGAIKDKPFTLDNAIMLSHEIKKIKDKIGGSILITTSKRTGSEPEKVIMESVKEFPNYSYLWGSTGVNPYMGFLACSDNIIVTGDSVSMTSEACGTGKPVFVFTGENWLTKKHLRFVESLCSGGYAVNIKAEKPLTFKPKEKLTAAPLIVKKIKELF